MFRLSFFGFLGLAAGVRFFRAGCELLSAALVGSTAGVARGVASFLRTVFFSSFASSFTSVLVVLDTSLRRFGLAGFSTLAVVLVSPLTLRFRERVGPSVVDMACKIKASKCLTEGNACNQR